jgi:hypothetical protein
MLQLADLCYTWAMTILFTIPFVVALAFAVLMFRQEMH